MRQCGLSVLPKKDNDGLRQNGIWTANLSDIGQSALPLELQSRLKSAVAPRTVVTDGRDKFARVVLWLWHIKGSKPDMVQSSRGYFHNSSTLALPRYLEVFEALTTNFLSSENKLRKLPLSCAKTVIVETHTFKKTLQTALNVLKEQFTSRRDTTAVDGAQWTLTGSSIRRSVSQTALWINLKYQSKLTSACEIAYKQRFGTGERPQSVVPLVSVRCSLQRH